MSQPPPPQISPLGPPRAQSRGDLGEGVPASAVRAPPAAPRPTILRGGGEAIGPSPPPPCVELWGWGCGGGDVSIAAGVRDPGGEKGEERWGAPGGIAGVLCYCGGC